MGSSEMDKPGKETKEPKTPTTQEPSLSTPSVTGNTDWPGFQAYSTMPPHYAMASNPQAPHPYIWGVLACRVLFAYVDQARRCSPLS